MRFYTVELLLSETYKEFKELLDYTDILDSCNNDGYLRDEDGEFVLDDEGNELEMEGQFDLAPYITKMWTMVLSEKDPLTQKVMQQQLEIMGWYDPVRF